MSSTVRVLRQEHLKQLITMEEAIEAVESGYRQLYQGKVVAPLRQHLPIAEARAVGLIMPVYAPAFQHISVKVANIFPDNPQRFGLPTTNAVLMLFDATTGRLLSLMDGEFLTALRTGAASGLATRLMAPRETKIGLVFGAGRQAEMQIKALVASRELEKIYVISRDATRGKQFVQRLSNELSIPLEWTSNRKIIREADIICAATTSHTPVLEDREIGQGVHINGVGSFRPEMIEIPPETLSRARVVVDVREACLAEAGEIVAAIQQGYLSHESIYEIGEVIEKRLSLRESKNDITFFKSVGHAIQDLAVASAALARAQDQQIGELVNL